MKATNPLRAVIYWVPWTVNPFKPNKLYVFVKYFSCSREFFTRFAVICSFGSDWQAGEVMTTSDWRQVTTMPTRKSDAHLPRAPNYDKRQRCRTPKGGSPTAHFPDTIPIFPHSTHTPPNLPQVLRNWGNELLLATPADFRHCHCRFEDATM